MDQQSDKVQESSKQQSTTVKKKQDQLIGTKVGDRYEVLSVIGYGTTTSVYKAQDTQRDNRLVAIKMLHTHSTASEMTVRRFEQECKTLALLRHANIVTQYDSGVTDQDQPYLVMEFLDGVTLKKMIEDAGVIGVKQALEIFIQACAGLAAAHEKGVVHRDMKPANIMVTRDEKGKDHVKILDFGVAKLLIQGETFQTKTQTGEMLGTLLYMSPEQCLDQDLDGRSDVYALGCVLFETLTGKPPLCGRTAFETMNKHLTEKPEKLSNVRPDLVFPARLERIVQTATEKEPKLRFQKINEFETNLKDLLAQVDAKPSLLKERPPVVSPPAPKPAPIAPPRVEEEEPVNLTNLLAEPTEGPPRPKQLPDQDNSREGTISFLAMESMDGVNWQRIYADMLKYYAISEDEVIQEKGRILARHYNLKDMEKFALAKFSDLDRNSDGFVSREELEIELKKPLVWRERHFISFLVQHLDDIRNVGSKGGHPKWPLSPGGVTRNDITDYFAVLQDRRKN